MPFTPYHFGPSGVVSLLCRRWLDVPVFIAANVLIDVEVIADSGLPWLGFGTTRPDWWFNGFAPGWPVHQIWHFHTLLIGGIAGAIFGSLVYYIRPLRWCSEKSMSLIGLPGKSTLQSMLLAGLLGACFHVLIDSFYHYDVQIFWPHPKNPIFQWAARHTSGGYRTLQQHIRLVCKIGWALMILLYALLLTIKHRKNKTNNT